jgi:hypothetical protein
MKGLAVQTTFLWTTNLEVLSPFPTASVIVSPKDLVGSVRKMLQSLRISETTYINNRDFLNCGSVYLASISRSAAQMSGTTEQCRNPSGNNLAMVVFGRIMDRAEGSLFPGS